MPLTSAIEHSVNPDRGELVKISKVGAGYVHVPRTEYRCRDCWKFLPKLHRCAEITTGERIESHGYCILWSKGGPDPGLNVRGHYTAAEVGYGTLVAGTLCRRCTHFNGKDACEIVRGRIDPQGCCDNQEPR